MKKKYYFSYIIARLGQCINSHVDFRDLQTDLQSAANGQSQG